jgi:outer membrane protein TolC
MLGSLSRWRRSCARLVGGLLTSSLLALAGAGEVPAQELPPAAPAALPPAVTVTALDLAACRQLALQHQPGVAAARASLAAAVARAQALDHLRVPTLLARDLPTRRKQSALGVTIAEAGVRVAENNTLYGVTYSYLSYLYASQQLRVVDNARNDLRALRKVVEQAVKEGTRRDLSARDVEKLDVYLLVAEGRREEAVQGAERARSALREALGIGPDHPVVLAQDRLLKAPVTPDRQQAVDFAVSRRPEMVMALYGAEVAGLEVCAQQARRCLPTVPTFAAGGDLHAQPLPAGSYDADYKPGAVGPEMPVTLNGSRADRVEVARLYTARAGAVVDKTRNLLALEAEQAYLRWAEATGKLGKYEQAAKQARALFKQMQAQFTPTDTKMALDPLLNNAILSTQLTAQVNEARYRQLLALAELERVTAGGLCAGLDTAPTVPEDENGVANRNNKKN